jgi:hypothetical protein
MTRSLYLRLLKLIHTFIRGWRRGSFSEALRQRRRRVLMAGVLLGLSGLACADNPSMTTESKVKAAFLFKFTNYVDWPPAAFELQDSPLVISVMEADDVASELSRLVAGRTVNNRAIVVRRLGAGDSATGSHVLFVGSSASGRLARILASARPQGMLTVTELDDTLAFGSVINFVLIDDQVRFDVSLPAAEKSNLKISSRLLTVAHQVVQVTP